ncbi:molybdopterin-guanine dinucleotide biosynthesis protein B [Virgibacillus sp. DJP39]|uniref:molybdopterin-guanine dinucleotide biosynthesis protein B n=1 Tax=Virgibacillus sp. DJP39 TaxID=3409790 RepID=UPI003BB6E040
MVDIVQIVGYKNSGKTTLMKKLIEHFTKNGIKVGSLKHHGHGGEINPPKRTDSTSHFEAGSLISGVQGESTTQLTFHNLTFGSLIQMYTLLPIDLLLIEGFKQATYPKIVLVRSADDLGLLHELSNIIAVGIQDDSIEINLSVPVFELSKVDVQINQLVAYIKNN